MVGLSAVSRPAVGARKVFGLIIGHNGSPSGTREPLEFADDDAFRAYELLARIAPEDHLRLLSVADPQSAGRFGYLTSRSKAPTYEHLREAVRSIAAAVDAAKAAGDTTEVYIFYSGHGELVRGYTSLSLADRLLSNVELEDEVLAPIKARRIHLVVDSCNAQALLAYRGADDGPEPPRVRRVKAQTRSTRAFFERLPHVGVIFSTSKAQRSFEDAEYMSGLFSHVVRSGLLGGADVDEDRLVTYRELRGFVDAAFAEVGPAVYRPRPLIHAPREAVAPDAEATEAVVDLTRTPRFELRPDITGHLTLEDDRRLRVVELNKAPDSRVALTFPKAGPRLYKLLRAAPVGASARLLEWWLGKPPEAGSAPVEVARARAPEWQGALPGARGAAEPRFHGLFAAPLTRGRLARLPPVEVAAALPPPLWLWALSVSGGVEEGHIDGLSLVGGGDVGVRVVRDRLSVGLRFRFGYGLGQINGDDYDFLRLSAELNPRYMVPLTSVGRGLLGLELGASGGPGFERQGGVRRLQVGPDGQDRAVDETFETVTGRVVGQAALLWIMSSSVEMSLDVEAGARFIDLKDRGTELRRALASRLTVYFLF